MAQVCLILPVTPFAPLADERVQEVCASLRGMGHTVECLAALDSRVSSPPSLQGAELPHSTSNDPGLSPAAIAALLKAQGDVFLLLDGTRGYAVEDVQQVLAPILNGEADLAIASRRIDVAPGVGGRLQVMLGRAGRQFLGTSDPLSGLVAVSPALVKDREFAPIGCLFALELAVRTEGRIQDVPASRQAVSSRAHWSLDDLRFAKRLADDRFGNFSRLIQFCFVGASGMIVDLSCYAFFQWLLSNTWLATAKAPVIGGSALLAVAAALAIAIALTWNFSLNRRLTFSYARRESVLKQFLAYALSNALGIILSYSLRLLLPNYIGYFQRHKLAAALVGIVTATGISFSMARWFVFARSHHSSTPPAADTLHTGTVTAASGLSKDADSTGTYVSPRNLSASVWEPL